MAYVNTEFLTVEQQFESRIANAALWSRSANVGIRNH